MWAVEKGMMVGAVFWCHGSYMILNPSLWNTIPLFLTLFDQIVALKTVGHSSTNLISCAKEQDTR